MPLYSLPVRSSLFGAALLALAGTLATPAAAQSGPKPTWSTVASPTGGTVANISRTLGMAADASGNVVVVGSFAGTATFGSTTLTSAGNTDIFVAKYAPLTNTWLWAVKAGGVSSDAATGVAVRGTSIYVSGTITNDRSNSSSVLFGPLPQHGATTANTQDAFLAKYTDAGTTATPVWTQVGGGLATDTGAGVAVSATGTSVYLTGTIASNLANTFGVVFGGSGTAAGTVAQAGATAGSSNNDLFLAKYTDNGTTATLGWTQVGGGTYDDYSYGVAASGASVYMVGTLNNNRANAQGVLFGGTGLVAGTAPQYGASTSTTLDIVLAKYTDNGTTATLGWTQVGGGNDTDYANAVAANGSRVYVVGNTYNNRNDNNAVRFGGSGTAAGTVAQAGASNQFSTDIVLAKYTDIGPTATLGWTQVAGGTGIDDAAGVAASGNRVYVAGYIQNNSSDGNVVLFGGSGLVGGTATQAGATTALSYDLVAAGYADNGATAALAWTQVGGGTGPDLGLTAAVVGTRLFVGGTVVPAATFGTLSITTPASAITAFTGSLDLTATLATTAAAAAPAPSLSPNPASGPATLAGAAPRTAGQVVDALGRPVAIFITDNTGTAALPAGLTPGLYLVRVGAATGRWVVQ